MSFQRALFLALILGLGGVGCGDDDHGRPDDHDSGGPDTGGPVMRCSGLDDRDSDFISAMDEGENDLDGDGKPNSEDTDSDEDGFGDAEEAGDQNCISPPADIDGDGMPDFLDTDANGDGLLDKDQHSGDRDTDGVVDGRDNDVDGDGITNDREVVGADGPRVPDTDGDGVPDVFDDDSDGDTILDKHETAVDVDMDGVPNFRDLDSDADMVTDAVEAGDADLMTPPKVCGLEVNPATGMVEADGRADFADADADNDGLGDGEELAIRTDPCKTDTDEDGMSDLAEGAYERINCQAGEGAACGCATRSECLIPDTDFFVILPFGGAPIERDLDFGTTIRVADVFFLTDTTGSMGGTLMRVQQTVAGPGGLIERIGEAIPDAWIGGGQHDDMPFGGYGSSPDEPFILAIGVTAPDRAAAVQAAFNGIDLHSGGDGAESSTEGIYQLITGEGGTWNYGGGGGWGGGGGMYTMRHYAGDCLDSGYGAACFREAALPIIVHFTDICSHNGPPGEDESSCDSYTGITPEPSTWSNMIAALNRRGAKYVGINVTSESCSGVITSGGSSPCYFMKQTAEATSSVDLDGNTLVYDLPDGGGSSSAFTETVVGAIETIATRVPLDVDTALRDDTTDTVDARLFIKRRQPACSAVPPSTPCWFPPGGVTERDAVAHVDQSTFYGVIPGTRVRFRITFQNDSFRGESQAKIFIAYIDVRGGGSAVLDTRQVFVIVPADSGIII